MNTEILDDHSENNNIVPKAQLINWISLLLLWGGMVYTLQSGLLLTAKVIAGIVLLILATIATYFKYRIGTKITMGVIILGILGLIKLFPFEFSLGFNLGSYGVSFNASMIAMAIIHILTNKEEMLSLFKPLLSSTISEEDAIANERSSIEGFKRRMSKKSLAELESIVEQGELVPAAILAAKELIQEK